MTTFCVATIDADPLQPHHGVLAGADLASIQDGRRAAAAIIAAAERDAAAAAQDMQEHTLRQAQALLLGLRQRHADLLDGVGAGAIALARGLFAQLAAQLPAADKVDAACRQLQAAAPRQLSHAVLFVPPGAAPGVDAASAWEVCVDAALPAGACRLEAGEGEWHADFNAGVAALLAALADAPASSLSTAT